VKNPHDQDAVLYPPIEHYVPSLLKTMQAGANPITGPPNTRIAGKHLNASLQIIEVPHGLGIAPCTQRVLANAQQACFRFA
jgi:hypothetical protein